jgi:hypothetical protein
MCGATVAEPGFVLVDCTDVPFDLIDLQEDSSETGR